METIDDRARTRWPTVLAAVGAVALVVAAAVASPAPADTPYVVLAWAAVAVGAAILVVEVGREPSRPGSARRRDLEVCDREDRPEHQVHAVGGQVDRDDSDDRHGCPVGDQRVRVP